MLLQQTGANTAEERGNSGINIFVHAVGIALIVVFVALASGIFINEYGKQKGWF